MHQDENISLGNQPEPLKPLRILIADDDQHLCRSTQALLQSEGYETCIVHDGAEAINKLEQDNYPLILLDLDMPKADGLTVIEHIKNRQLDTAIVVLSGESDINKALQVVKAGAQDFVRKPSNPEELLLALRKVQEKRQLEKLNRRMVEELRRSEDLHRFIVQNSPDLMFLLNQNGDLAFVNNMRRLLGIDDHEALGKHFTEFIHPQDLARAKHYFGEERIPTSNGKLELKLQEKNSNRIRHVEISATKVARTFPGGYPLHDQSAPPSRRFVGYYGVARDITEKKRSEELIRYQHNHDILTGLPNRGLLNDRLLMLLNHARRRQEQFALAYIDIDRFKLINDTYGQVIGDEILQSIADTLKRCIRKEDTLARYGGDEFVLLLPGVDSQQDLVTAMNKIIRELSIPYRVNGQEIHITVSIGIALYPEHGEERELLLKRADTAVCNVKSGATSSYCIYHEGLTDHNSGKVSKENLIREALKNNSVAIHYQPQIDLAKGRLHAAEALVRLHSPDGELIMPAQFIPVAEESYLINELGEAIIDKVCQEVKAWQLEGVDVPVSINISARQLVREDFSETFFEHLRHYSLDPKLFELELTENVLIQNLEKTLSNLTRLTAAGVRIAIDDFGKGYSSLSYLDQLPLHTLKLDKQFIKRLNSIIPAIINVSQALNLHFIAEGVETQDQHAYLKAHPNCIAQGYYYSKPIGKTEFLTFVKNFDFSSYD